MIEKPLANTLLTGALVAGALKENTTIANAQNKENTQPVVSPASSQYVEQEDASTSELAKEDVPLSSSEEVAQFDSDILDFTEWKNYNLESVERTNSGYTATISQETSLFLIPLRNDNFLDDRDGKMVKEIILPKNYKFEIGEIRTIKGSNNEEIRFGVVANTFGEHSASVVLLSAVDKNGVKKEFTTESLETNRTVSYIVSEEHIYPNKIINTLLALRNISQYQDENGPFMKGNEYSCVKMFGIDDPTKKSEFTVGLASDKTELRGGGVCATATALSMLVHTSDKGNMNIKEQWGHPIRYAQGPFSPSEYVVDATVGLNPTYDFRWVQEETKYLKIDALLSPSDITYDKTESDGVGGLSDSNMIVNISFVDTPPVNQTVRIQYIKDNYVAFRESKHEIKLLEDRGDVNVLTHDIGKNKEIVNLMYNAEEDINFKEYDIKELENIQKLKEAVNSYPADSEEGLYKYLSTTDWYKESVNEKNKEYVDRILELVSITKIPGQPLQCMGFVMMLSWLYPSLDIPYIGGGPASARELAPAELRSAKYENTSSYFSGFANTFAIGGKLTISDYEPGDLYVRTDGVKMQSTGKPAGHVGVILGKRVDGNGNTVLLAADSNRLGDGKIRIFEVDKWNEDEIFSNGRRYLLRLSKKSQ